MVPEVGRTYKVNCALIIHDGGPYYIPLIGVEHKDPQLGVDVMHYHIDGRFLTANEMRFLGTTSNGKTNKVLSKEPGYNQIVRTIYKYRKCHRIITGLTITPVPDFVGGLYTAWYRSMLGKSCKGRKCPHLGTPMLEQNGVLICPLHNLHGCMEREVII